MTMATVPAKIVMKGTAQMSLHDRFSELSELMRSMQQSTGLMQEVKMLAMNGPSQMMDLTEQRYYRQKKTAFDNQIDARSNEVLVRDMANRPSVRNALFAKQSTTLRENWKRVEQRLPPRYRLGPTRGAYPMKKRFNFVPRRYNIYRPYRNNYQYRPFPPRYRYHFNNQNSRQNWRGQYNAFTRGRGRGRGRGRYGFNNSYRPTFFRVTKLELDRQLDMYMSKSASVGKLDNEIDSYMSELNL